MKTKSIFILLVLFLMLPAAKLFSQQKDTTKTNPPIYIAFHWHMHQPIYMPYENVVTTANSGVYSFNLYDVFNTRSGPYTSWPKDAVQKGINASLPHLGAQVSLSGSLVENLNNLEAGGHGFSNWKSHWNYITGQKTTENNPRIDLVAFGYHHPLMGLLEYSDIRKSIQDHRAIFATNFPNYSYSKGIFPPENAFSERMIPALVDEGIEWVFVDNIHFDRTAVGCPVGDQSGVMRPNKADVLMPNPNDWLQLNGLWAPIPISIQWAHQPHYVQHIDPNTGQVKKIIAVPTSRYLGNEDGRGGFGALQYDAVMSQMESYNTDPNHPILIVLHHDGDNYGGGSEGYYGGNFQAFVDWLQANPSRFVCTTVQDYVDMFPPAEDDIIHVQDGSWSGADNGDPEFKKWNADPGTYQGTPNYSPDRNSWGIVTAAKNIVQTAEQVNPTSNFTKNAWKYYLNSQTSCYWYWDGTEMWDSHPARACNMAVTEALNIVGGSITDLTPPTIYVPQREPYNPGDIEWGSTVMPSDFKVWTYVYDFKGLQSVKLKYRTVNDGVHTVTSSVNRTYAGGAGVSAWTEISMTGVTIPSITNPVPTYKAQEYSAMIEGLENVLVDYYVEAVDNNGNIAKSQILHVWVGDGTGGSTSNVFWEPEEPTLNEYVTITCSYATANTMLHWGVNAVGGTWITPNTAYRPAGSNLFNGTGPAVETPFSDPDNDGVFTVVLGPFNNAAQVVNTVDFVIHNGDQWDNNGGGDYHITINNTPGEEPIGANNSVSTPINTDYVFLEEDFYFVGSNGATFAGIKIVNTVTLGALKSNGISVIEGQDYDVNNLVFSPVIGATGVPYTNFRFRVKDNNGLYSTATYTFTINVPSSNPTSASSSINIAVDETYTFSSSNFPFESPIGNNFASIIIETLPENGVLKYDNNAVTFGTEYSDVSLLTFTPDLGEAGVPYTSFTFSVKDDEDLISTFSYTLTVNVVSEIPAGVSWLPEIPTQYDMVTIFVKGDDNMSTSSLLHWGVNGWQMPLEEYRPEGSVLHSGTGPAVQSPFVQNGDYYYVNIGPFSSTQVVNVADFVLYYGTAGWNNNGGADWHININNVINIEAEKSEQTVSISPNPMSNYSFIKITDEKNTVYDVQIIDISGKIIIKDKFESNQNYVLQRNGMTSGVYYIRFINEEENKYFYKKLIVN